MSIVTVEYQRGRGDAERAGIASYWTTTAHHAGIAHLARFAHARGQDDARRAREPQGQNALSADQAVSHYLAVREEALVKAGTSTSDAHDVALRSVWGTAYARGRWNS